MVLVDFYVTVLYLNNIFSKYSRVVYDALEPVEHRGIYCAFRTPPPQENFIIQKDVILRPLTVIMYYFFPLITVHPY